MSTSRSLRHRSVDHTKRLRIVSRDHRNFYGGAKRDLSRRGQPKSIPIPKGFKEHRVGASKQRKWQLPPNYVHYQLNTGSGLPTPNDFYDLLKEDLMWLNKENRKRQKNSDPSHAWLKEYDMSRLITEFEHHAARLPQGVQSFDCTLSFTHTDCDQLAQKLGIPSNKASKVFDYWLGKRKKYSKPLLRKYVDPPNFDDQNPNVAFRPRQPNRRISARSVRSTSHRPRRSTETNAYIALSHLKRDFRNLRTLLRAVTDREKMKRHQFLLDAQIFDEKLAITPFGRTYHKVKNDPDPNNPLKMKDDVKLFSRLLTSNVPISDYADTPAARRDPSLRIPSRKAQQRGLGYGNIADEDALAPGSDSELESDEETEDEVAFYAEVERRLELLRNPPASYDGSQVLDADSLRSHDSHMELSSDYRGVARARIDRSNRLVFDIDWADDGNDSDTGTYLENMESWMDTPPERRGGLKPWVGPVGPVQIPPYLRGANAADGSGDVHMSDANASSSSSSSASSSSMAARALQQQQLQQQQQQSGGFPPSSHLPVPTPGGPPAPMQGHMGMGGLPAPGPGPLQQQQKHLPQSHVHANGGMPPPHPPPVHPRPLPQMKRDRS